MPDPTTQNECSVRRNSPARIDNLCRLARLVARTSQAEALEKRTGSPEAQKMTEKEADLAVERLLEYARMKF